MFCMIFMTLFGKKIASVVRIATVFAASSIPILMATLGPHQDDPTLPVGWAARHSAPRPSSAHSELTAPPPASGRRR
jgi:hypothetical protein